MATKSAVIYIIWSHIGGVMGVLIFKARGVGLVSAQPQFKLNNPYKAPLIIPPILV
jgi:hypothetical protein